MPARQEYGHHPVAPDMHPPNTFIPPQAERIPQRPRMPRIEDLPMPAQRQILQKRGELATSISRTSNARVCSSASPPD